MRSWKSTLLGIAGGVLNLVSQGVNWKTALQSVAIAALGAVVKDYNVSGATAPPSKDQATK